jgi:Entner-Doudoroff aldolase
LTPLANEQLSPLFADQSILVILRNLGPEESLRLAHLAWDTGVDCIEVTLQSKGDAESLALIVREGKKRGRKLVGAGTIVRPTDLDIALENGAAFTVSPGLDLELVRRSHEMGMPSIPGVATPSEVQQALSRGLTWLKAFPASHLGPSWFEAIRGPFPEAKFLATGGMKTADVPKMLAAGVRLVALGSALTKSSELDALSALVRKQQENLRLRAQTSKAVSAKN